MNARRDMGGARSGSRPIPGGTQKAPATAPLRRLGTHPELRAGPGADCAEYAHVALVGFMGSGKSSVGMLLAERSGRRFIDLDEAIEDRAGMPITKIFREQGEVGFRALERASLRDVLAEKEPLIIATGGGTFVDPTMREWLSAAATTVYLKASAAALAARVAHGDARSRRPLLAGPDPVSTIHRLLSERVQAYEQCSVTVNAEQGDAAEIAEAIVRALKWDRPGSGRRRAREGRGREHAESMAVTSAPGEIAVASRLGDYPILLRPDGGRWLAEEIADRLAGQRLMIVTDATVAGLHLEPLQAGLEALGRNVSVHVVQPGEGSKSMATAAALWEALTLARLSRSDGMVALGGGVVGDLAGFAASTYLRGIDLVQVPTTTLASVDSSVGGKTALNTPHGKNLVGTFYAPKAVLIAADHLRTQSIPDHAAGLVEALKMAATMDVELFSDLETDARALLAFEPAALLQAIARAVSLKAAVVSRDEQERGERAVLNYGHTLGHAIEAGSGFRMRHGDAVALGMVGEAAFAEERGWSVGVSERLCRALEALGVSHSWEHLPVDLEALGHDKKRVDAGVRLPIVRSLGSYEFRSVPLSILQSFVRLRSQP